MQTVFLDRDGVINRRLPGDYVKRWEEFEFLPGALEGLRALSEAGFRLIIVTNQRGVSIGRLRESELGALHERLRAELKSAGVRLDAIYACPHDYDSCRCRKPEVGLFLQAKRDFPEIEFPDSFVIGDSASDIEAGVRLGCKTVLVGADIQNILPELTARNLPVDFKTPTLLQAVREYLITPVAR